MKTETCWPWSAGIHRSGYGIFSVHSKQVYAHRYSFELHNGPIPQGLVLDHVCHGWDRSCISGIRCLHRRCVNPQHLEAVPFAENVYRGNTLAAENAAKTHCPVGHPYDVANTYITPEGWRVCRECSRKKDAKRRKAVTS
ncbi:HNH endonuclease signature motif containing protein [Streptomyces sp. NPDC057580]|uniref:HNH endonuclease signature motif containing protein n=1 Tax=Streptomyces sp. NPDC057580 TaxID=3346173 RepID=UPI00368CD348